MHWNGLFSSVGIVVALAQQCPTVWPINPAKLKNQRRVLVAFVSEIPIELLDDSQVDIPLFFNAECVEKVFLRSAGEFSVGVHKLLSDHPHRIVAESHRKFVDSHEEEAVVGFVVLAGDFLQLGRPVRRVGTIITLPFEGAPRVTDFKELHTVDVVD